MTAGELAELVFSHMMDANYTPGNGIRDVVPVGTPAPFRRPRRFHPTLPDDPGNSVTRYPGNTLKGN